MHGARRLRERRLIARGSWTGRTLYAALTLAVLTVGVAEANTKKQAVPPEAPPTVPPPAPPEVATIPVETLSIGPAASDLPAAALLRGADARRQLIVTARSTDGDEQDFTHRVEYTPSPEGIVSISPDGLVTPLADGEVTITATWDPTVTSGVTSRVVPTGGSAASYKAVAGQIKLTVTEFERQPPVNFANQIVPIFTKYGFHVSVHTAPKPPYLTHTPSLGPSAWACSRPQRRSAPQSDHLRESNCRQNRKP